MEKERYKIYQEIIKHIIEYFKHRKSREHRSGHIFKASCNGFNHLLWYYFIKEKFNTKYYLIILKVMGIKLRTVYIVLFCVL